MDHRSKHKSGHLRLPQINLANGLTTKQHVKDSVGRSGFEPDRIAMESLTDFPCFSPKRARFLLCPGLFVPLLLDHTRWEASFLETGANSSGNERLARPSPGPGADEKNCTVGESAQR